jgi:hypothetical protein
VVSVKKTFWVAKLRYGHVGHGNEVCVNRYLEMEADADINDVINLINTMPGVKSKGNHSYRSIKKIDQEEFYQGRQHQSHNLFLKKLWSYKKHAA